jgi:hypothetical protein
MELINVLPELVCCRIEYYIQQLYKKDFTSTLQLIEGCDIDRISIGNPIHYSDIALMSYLIDKYNIGNFIEQHLDQYQNSLIIHEEGYDQKALTVVKKYILSTSLNMLAIEYRTITSHKLGYWWQEDDLKIYDYETDDYGVGDEYPFDSDFDSDYDTDDNVEFGFI